MTDPDAPKPVIQDVRPELGLPPRTCEHGMTLGALQLLPGDTWNGPMSRCRCCLGDFGYIDTARFGSHRVVTDTWTPKDLCGGCGGKMVHYDSAGSDV